jgi:hypothetical protein
MTFVRPVAMLSLLLATVAAPSAAQLRTPLAGRGDAWPVKTREYVDRWLHGFALLTEDSARVPLFRRGYREAVTVAKNRRNIVTDLDANADVLRARLVAQPSLANAQFAVLAFESDAELEEGLAAFLAANGDPRRARSRDAAQMVAYLATYFPTTDDREWARTFANALKSESGAFHHAWWLEEQRRRAGALAAVDSLWQRGLRRSLDRFLGVTKQDGGSLILALAVEGEGRTALFGQRQNVVVVPLPDSAAAAADAMYVAAHELVGAVTGPVIEDNITPAQKRGGEADRLSAVAAVRGGLMLLQKAAPAMAEGYARFYLRVAQGTGGAAAASGTTVPAGEHSTRTANGVHVDDPVAALERAFPMPEAMVETLRRHIELSFGGI